MSQISELELNLRNLRNLRIGCRDSRITASVGGRRALSCVADYTEKKRNMAEHVTWVRTEVSLALFFIRMPAEKLDAFRQRFNPTIESLRIP
jgi:hypothetical protein